MNDGHRRRPGWAPYLEPGRRVVLRYAIDRTSSPHGESMSDALGTILAADESVVRVQLEGAGERKTRLSLVHGALKSERLARDYELAWSGFLGILAHQMEAQVGWRD